MYKQSLKFAIIMTISMSLSGCFEDKVTCANSSNVVNTIDGTDGYEDEITNLSWCVEWLGDSDSHYTLGDSIQVVIKGQEVKSLKVLNAAGKPKGEITIVNGSDTPNKYEGFGSVGAAEFYFTTGKESHLHKTSMAFLMSDQGKPVFIYDVIEIDVVNKGAHGKGGGTGN